ncbi:hypothetical protein B0H19DRAFT_1065293 [Mycena capillaripes]|nr:hypothetical protein B0H19DRAFT_1065293 [Mycena capillaripes]
MKLLAAEVQLSIAANLHRQDLNSLSSSTFLFAAVKLDPRQLRGFHKALDIRFKSCIVKSLHIRDSTDLLLTGNPMINDRFVKKLHQILQSVSQICCLRLNITVHAGSFLGYYMDPRYPEAVLSCQFKHLEEFHYVIQGEYQNGGDSVHLPGFLNSHPTIKRLHLTLSPSPHCRVFIPIQGITLNLPQLQLLDVPMGYLVCNFGEAHLLHNIQMTYPQNALHNESANSMKLEKIWMDGKLSVMLSNAQNLTVKRFWGFNNVDILAAVAINFGNLSSLNIQGQYWVGVNGGPISSILSKFTQLEIFQYGKKYPSSYKTEIQEEKIAQTWRNACPSLKKICIRNSEILLVTMRDWKL